MPYLERAGYITGRLKPEGFAYLASLVPLFNTSVDRLDQVPARLRQLFRVFAGGGARGRRDSQRGRAKVRRAR